MFNFLIHHYQLQVGNHLTVRLELGYLKDLMLLMYLTTLYDTLSLVRTAWIPPNKLECLVFLYFEVNDWRSVLVWVSFHPSFLPSKTLSMLHRLLPCLCASGAEFEKRISYY